MRRRIVILAAVLVTTACGSGGPGAHSPSSPQRAATTPTTAAVPSPVPVATTTGGGSLGPTGLPRPAHVLIVVLENHSFDEVVDPSRAPFIAGLASGGAVFTRYFAITHPSEPNYLALFSGSTQGVTNDACPVSFGAGNLARSLLEAGRTFTGYSEDLPSAGFTGCTSGEYARRHVPWTDFTDLPASVNQPLTSFPTNFTKLPTVSFVIPNLVHDMHDGPLPQADTWLHDHLGAYATWARSHDSLLVLTADEDDGGSGNRVATIISGAHVRAGRYAQPLTHYSLLRTIEDMYGLPRLGKSATAAAITGVWN